MGACCSYPVTPASSTLGLFLAVEIGVCLSEYFYTCVMCVYLCAPVCTLPHPRVFVSVCTCAHALHKKMTSRLCSSSSVAFGRLTARSRQAVPHRPLAPTRDTAPGVRTRCRTAGGAETGLWFPARCQVFGTVVTHGDSGFPGNLIPGVLTRSVLGERMGGGASVTSKEVSRRANLPAPFFKCKVQKYRLGVVSSTELGTILRPLLPPSGHQ